MAKPIQKRPRDHSTPPLERSMKMKLYKEERGLPTQADLQKLESSGLVDAVNAKIERMERYAAAQRTIVATIAATGWSLTNVVERIVDLEVKLVELGDKLEAEGINPVTDDAWMNARRELMKDIAFAHKHGLEVTKLQQHIREKEDKMNEDVEFKVE